MSVDEEVGPSPVGRMTDIERRLRRIEMKIDAARCQQSKEQRLIKMVLEWEEVYGDTCKCGSCVVCRLQDAINSYKGD